ncbi:hypothetical protein PENSPDRAFT_650063 [Peniophora sp. CONT]|nr:hypothetical protein PENSPDRAFT_650063 [Peniophora sp. CONT]
MPLLCYSSVIVAVGVECLRNDEHNEDDLYPITVLRVAGPWARRYRIYRKANLLAETERLILPVALIRCSV